jgi:hypothetical protein
MQIIYSITSKKRKILNLKRINNKIFVKAEQGKKILDLKRLLILFISLIFSLAIFSCDQSEKPAMGSEDEIYVVADSLEFEKLKGPLNAAFEKLIYTPQPEKLFILHRISLNELEEYRAKKNIIIIAPLDSKSTASDFVKAVIDSSIERKIRDEEEFAVKKHDLWAKDQLVLILTAPSVQKLQSKIINNKDDLLYSFQKISDRRLTQNLYSSRYEQEEVEGKLLKEYGWVIYVQSDFELAINDPQSKFVSLKRAPEQDMEKWIFVHWIDNVSPEYLNGDSVRTIRNRLTKTYYTNKNDSSYITIAKDYYMTSEVNFNGKYAILTQGLWEENPKGKEGPFINYTFYDDRSKRVYMLDGCIYAPKYYKRNLIQQADVLLQSFMTYDEISKEKREELLSSVKE